MLGEKESQSLCQKVLQRCGNDPAEVLLFVDENALTRFANNTIHQNVSEVNINLTVRYFIGKRMGTASTNRMDTEALDRLVERARANAKASPEDPDYPGLPGKAAYSPVKAFDSLTAEYSPMQRAKAVGEVCRPAWEKGLNASVAFSTGIREIIIANSEGLFAYFATTNADFQTILMGEGDASARAQGSAWRVGDVPVEQLGQQAIQKAVAGKNPQIIPPGEYTVVFEHYVTVDLLAMLNFYGMSAQAVLEGRSWMNNRMNSKAMSDMVSIWDDGLDPKGSPMPFDSEGVPKRRVDIVSHGVVQGPVYDRYTGKKAGKDSTGHALHPTMRSLGPLPTNLFMAPGNVSLEEMIRSTEKGLYINRFWYTRLVHPSDCVITGMTRDGVFMIENGEITYPVKNLRFTQSYVHALADVESVGKETHLLADGIGNIASRVPAVKIRRFNFTGSTV